MSFVARRRDRPSETVASAVKLQDNAGNVINPASNDVLNEIGSLVLLGYTTSPLAANGSWISAVDSGLNTGRVVGTVFADQPGTLYVEQSPNNVNWDVVDGFSVSVNVGLGFSVEKVCPYVRVRYVNGATAQTVFRLYVFKRLRVV
jgi:hypothetical protein